MSRGNSNRDQAFLKGGEASKRMQMTLAWHPRCRKLIKEATKLTSLKVLPLNRTNIITELEITTIYLRYHSTYWLHNRHYQ
jgi:hypothetical protein